MKIQIFQTHDELSDFVAGEILDTVRQKPEAMLTLATGDTPLLTYKKLSQLSINGDADWSRVKFAALDEWVGVPPENPGSCKSFLNENIFNRIPLQQQNIHLFDVRSADLEKECAKMDHFIRNHGPVDLMLVGIGVSGHIGFNEPGVSADLYSHVIDLESTTKSVGQKYFPSDIVLSQGITLGLKHILQAKKVIVIANGHHKAGIIKASLKGEITNNVPATLLRRHPGALFALDSEAATLLDS